jgi:hypothetical protein
MPQHPPLSGVVCATVEPQTVKLVGPQLNHALAQKVAAAVTGLPSEQGMQEPVAHTRVYVVGERVRLGV